MKGLPLFCCDQQRETLETEFNLPRLRRCRGAIDDRREMLYDQQDYDGMRPQRLQLHTNQLTLLGLYGMAMVERK